MAYNIWPNDDSDEDINRLQRVVSTPARYSPWLSSGADSSLIRRANDRAGFIDCDEIVKNLYLGGESAARNKTYLQLNGFTHVLNAAHGKSFGQVLTGQSYYRNTNIHYKGISVHDLSSESISKYFDEAAEFIDAALRGGGKILVHCVMGISRSVTLVCAYLMIKQRHSAEEALTIISRARDVRPNDGFLRQLLQLEQKLRHKKRFPN